MCSDSKQDLPPALSPRYQSRGLIKSGGQGSVHKAFDTLIDRMVAIKVLERYASQKELLRFQLEARSASKLKHPNILAVHDFILDPSGKASLVMEFIDGPDLDAYLKENGQIDLRVALLILDQIIRGMEHAHTNGVMHRDLKPHNVLLDMAGPRDHLVRIADFGLARSIEGDPFSTGSVGGYIGSPSYMSPEQARGTIQNERSDIYSFGCLAFELLTSEKAFDGESLNAIVLKQINDAPPPLPLVSIDPRVQAGLADLINWCLAKDPQDRPASFTEIRETLASILTIQSIQDETESDTTSDDESEQSENKSRTEKTMLKLLIAAAAVFCLGSVAFMTKAMFFSESELQVSQQQVDNAVEQMAESDNAQTQSQLPAPVSADTPSASVNIPDMDLSEFRFTECNADDKKEFDRLMRAHQSYLHLKGNPSREDVSQLKENGIRGLICYPARTSLYSRMKSQHEAFEHMDRRNMSIGTMHDLMEKQEAEEKKAGFLAQISTITSLKTLVLKNTGFADSDLSPLTELKNLETLYIESQYLHDEAIEVFVKLKHLQNLFLLQMAAVSDNGLDLIGKNLALKRFLLTKPMISHEGISRLLKREKELEFFGLNDFQLDSKTMSAIAQSHLKRLDLSNTNADLKLVSQLKNCKTLTKLTLMNCSSITDDDLAKIKKTLPQCEIVR